MKIGIFDSGIGGLLVIRAIVKKLPQYDYIYLGDTKHVPYGDKSQEVIYDYTKKGVEYLFKKGCNIIILACNTASTRALRKLQREYLPKHYPDRRILGIIIPTVEAVSKSDQFLKLGVLATEATVDSKVFPQEIKKINKKAIVFQQSAPLLATMIEKGGLKWIDPALAYYLKPLMKNKVNAVLLGCTHYPIVKNKIRKIVGKKIKVISQDEIVPEKLVDYLKRHPELESKLTKQKIVEFYVTDRTPQIEQLAYKWFGKTIKLKLVKL